jgi:deoxycytidylate deaminase
MNYDWSELAFANKKSLRDLKAVFIAAPRELSQKRFTQLVKEYLPKGNIVLGIAKEDYIEGFDGQPQFRTLRQSTVTSIIDRVNRSAHLHKIYTLSYAQRDLPFILEKITFRKVLLINGSWRQVFHSSPAYYILTSKHVPYEMLSPFTDEKEAREYGKKTSNEIVMELDKLGILNTNKEYSELGLLNIAQASAKRSYDYGFQAGLSLAKKIAGKPGKYEFLISTYNKVVPYQTYALHHGSLREKHFSPPNDLNYYDTIHAEVFLLIEAQKAKFDLRDTILFINLMPCPTCARMLSDTDISEIVYTLDHSDGYAVKLLQEAGKKVRRVVL